MDFKSSPIPLYRSHKLVRGFKVGEVKLDEEKIFLVPEDPLLSSVEVTSDYLNKHDPQPGGYFVLYEDGYMSWSPAATFEKGNARVPE